MKGFWTYQAPPTPTEPPPDCDMTQEQWYQLTPGYRRAIWDGYEKMKKNEKKFLTSSD